MKACPNTNSLEWKLLEKKAGLYDAAFDLFIQNGEETPSIEQIEEYFKGKELIPTDKEGLITYLKSKKAPNGANLFREEEGQLKIVNKKGSDYNLSNAYKVLGSINSQFPGKVKLSKDRFGKIVVSVIEGQLPLFDLPSTNTTNNLLLPGFKSFYQQKEVVDVLSSSVLAYYRDNKQEKLLYSKAIESIKQNITDINKSDPREVYQLILNNLDALSLEVRDKLQALRLIAKPKLEGTSLDKSTEVTEDEEGVEGAEVVGSQGQDEWVFQYDSKDNALEAIKKFLAFIPKTVYNKSDDSFKLVESIIPKQPVFLSYDEVYEQLKSVLAGVDNTWEAMEEELRLNAKGKPFINTLLKKINNYKEDKEQLKRQFVSTMSSSYGNFKTIIVKDRTDREGNILGQYFNVIDTDRTSIEKTIISKWQGDFKRSNLFDEVDGDLILSKEKVEEYRKRLKEIKEEPTLENVKEVLEKIGITISDNTLDRLVNGVVNRLSINQQFTSDSGLFKLIDLRLGAKEVKEGEDEFNELDEETIVNDPTVNNSAIRALAKLDSYNNESYYSNTFKDGEGNTVYSYTFNKFLTKEFNKILNDDNHVKSLLDITFNKPIFNGETPIYDTWLYLRDTKPELFKEIFTISPLDTLKVGKDGTKLSSMSDLDLEITQLALMQNSGSRKKGLGGEDTKGTRIIKYLITVPDKTTSYVVQGTGIDVKLFFDKEGYRIGKRTIDALYSVVASEHNRILSQQARKSENKAYNKGSNFFFFFPTLNDLIFNKDENGKKTTVKLPTDKIGDKTVEQIIKEELNRIIKNDVSNKLQQWKELGISSQTLKLVDYNYLQKILASQTDDQNNQLTLAAADYIVNSILAKFNSHQTFIDDPAVYFKTDVATTWDNVGKRLTNLIAPFKEGMIDSTNKYFLSVKLADIESSALNNAQLAARLSKYYEDNNIGLPYDAIKGTDAQEYITLTEKLKVMYMYGEISTKLYNDLLEKIKTQGNNLVLTKDELEKILFSSDKPVYSSRIVSKEDDTIYREYIKSSSLPLIPQFTQGLEIDKLRVAMEKLQNSSSKSVRAAFNTATKLGGKQSINIWNTDGTIKDDLDLTSYAVELDRSNFGIQQEIPYDETKDETVRSTQVLKLLFDSIEEVSGFRYDNKVYSGQELKKIYDDLQNQIYEDGLKSIEKRIVKNGQLNKPELIKLLKGEGIKRNYSPAQISFLISNLENTDFEIPFWAHTNNDKEQSMLTSIWTNKVLKQKMPGGSYVLVSEEGMQGKSVGALYSQSYDPATGLKPMRIVYKKDTEQLEEEEYKKLSKADREGYREIVKPAQVIMSWNLRDQNGKLLNQNDYITTDEQGNKFLDTKKIPKELLNQFGFRIPNQGHNSMSLIEIVGFLPDIYQGVVIASRNFVTQMGSDFDVDKLYVYNYYLNADKEGNLSKQDDAKNKLVDIHKSVLYNKSVFESVVKPLDLGKISYETADGKKGGIAEKIKKQENTNKENYLNPDYSKNKYLQSVDGKAMVGITSVSNTFSTLLQGKEISLQKVVVINDEKQYVPNYIIFEVDGKIKEFSDLSSAFTYSGRKKNELHQSIQSASVDNGNNPILSYINVNPATSSALTLMLDLGLEEDEIYGLLAQPILKEYTKRVKLSKSKLQDEIKREEDTLLDLIKENSVLYNELSTKLKMDDLENYPLSKNHFNQVLFNEGKTDLTNEEIQVLVLQKFAQLKEIGDKLSRFQNLLNIESKGVGKSLLDLSDRRTSIDKLFNSIQFKNINKLVGEFDEGELTPNTITGYALTNSIFAADDVIKNSNLMPYSTEEFKKLLKQYESITNKEPNTDQKYEVWKAIKAFIFSNYFDPTERTRIFFDGKDNKSLNTRINALRKTKLKNNQFILRLDLSKVDLSGKNPSYVFYNSSKEADIEELNTYKSFYELVYNEDPEIVSIGQDLIRYFYLNGGITNSKDWGRFIDASMLTNIGLSEFAKTVNFSIPETYGYKPEISDVLLQLFQHKPYLTVRLNNTADVKIKDGVITINKEKIPRELISASSTKPVVVFNLNKKLYKLDNRDEDGNYIYRSIPTLGKKFFNEYQQDKVDNPVDFQIRETVNNPQTYPNPFVEDEFDGILDVTVSEALSNINNNKYHKELVNLFKKLEGIIGNIKIESTEEVGYFGRWDQKTIGVSLKELEDKGRLNRETVESTILKEIVHVLNTKLFRSEFTPTPEQIQARAAINTLYNSIRERVLSGELTQWNSADFIKYESILAKLRSKKGVTDQENEFLLTNKAKFYGLTNVEDFLHDALLQEEFRDLLNSIPYDADKSLLDRFIDLISEILNKFGKLVNINKGSALEEAFVQLIKLTNETNQQSDNTTQDEQIFYDLAEKKIKKEEQKNYEKVIKDFEVREKRISEDITKANANKDKVLATTLTNRLKEIRLEKEELIADNTLETLIKFANNDFKYIESILAKPELNESELERSSLYLGTWSNIDNIDIYKILSSYDVRTESPKAIIFKEIAEKAKRLNTRIEEAKIEVEIQLVQDLLKRNVSRDQLTVHSDVGYTQSKTRDISTSNNVILDVVDQLIRTADFATTTELNKLIKRVEDLTEKLSKLNITSREDFARVFGQVDEDGQLTGSVVSALSYEYFRVRDLLLENIKDAPNPGAKKKASEKYYNWIKENHIIVDPNKLYQEDNDGIFIYKPDAKYLQALEKELGEDYQKVIKEAKEKTEEYNDLLRLQIEATKDNPDAARILETWKLENSPLIYIDNLVNGLTIRKSEGKIIYNHGWQFISKRAKSQWEDSKYNELQKNDDLKEYYDWYVSTMKELNEYLPYNVRKNLKSTDIPSISKKLLEELHDTGINKYANRTWSALLEELSVKKNEVQKLVNPETGKEEKQFSFQYLEELDPKDKSYNLTQVIKLFAAQAIGYKHKSQIEDKIRLSQSILDNALETDKVGKTTTTKGLANLRSQLNYAIDAGLYGIKKDNKEGRSNIQFITSADKEKLAREIQKIEASDMTDVKKANAISKATEKYTRVLTWSKVGDTLLQYTQLKGMGWNIFGGVNNALFGQLANANWAATGVDYSDDDLQKAIGTMLIAQSPNDSSTRKKVESLMIKFNTVKQLRDKIYSATTNYNKARKGLQKLSPYELYAQGEYFVQGQVMVALLNATKVKVTEDGVEKEISLFEAFDENGNWNTEKFGENSEYSELGANTLKFKFKLDSLLKKIHGNYDPNANIAINEKFVGRALIQFRRWIPEGVAQRFDGEKYDNYLERTTKGRYLTYYDLGWKNSLKTLLKLAITRGKDSSFKDLNLEEDNLNIVKENMKKNLREIYFKLSMMGMFMLLSGLDDDDEWTRRAKNYSLNTILRLQDDIEFYYSPMAFDNITRSALPVSSIIVDFAKFSDSFVDTLEGNGEYKSGKHSGDSKLLWKGAKLLPLTTAVTNLINKGEAQESFRK